MKRLTLIALLASASIAPAFAGDVYVLGAVGQSKFSADKGAIDQELVHAGATSLASSLDENDTAYKIQLGYQLTPNLAIEGGYVDLGKAGYSASYTGGAAQGSVKASGINIAALGILPLNDSFSVFARLGTIRAKVEASASATGPGGAASGSVSSTDWKANWGIGASYNVTRQFGVRLEYEQFHKLGDSGTTGEGDVNLLSLGLSWKF